MKSIRPARLTPEQENELNAVLCGARMPHSTEHVIDVLKEYLSATDGDGIAIAYVDDGFEQNFEICYGQVFGSGSMTAVVYTWGRCSLARLDQPASNGFFVVGVSRLTMRSGSAAWRRYAAEPGGRSRTLYVCL